MTSAIMTNAEYINSRRRRGNRRRRRGRSSILALISESQICFQNRTYRIYRSYRSYKSCFRETAILVPRFFPVWPIFNCVLIQDACLFTVQRGTEFLAAHSGVGAEWSANWPVVEFNTKISGLIRVSVGSRNVGGR
jgi:hypothetical protein